MDRIKRFFFFIVLALLACWLILQAETDGRWRSYRNRGEITYEQMFQEIAAEYDLDWRLLARQAYRESGLNPKAVGLANDMGLMQILPSTWEEWAPRLGVSDPFDPYSNVLVGAAYLDFCRDYFSELGYTDPHWMLVAYNWGPYNLDQHLRNGGDWNQVPTLSRQYALDILQTSEAPFDWALVEAELIVRTSVRR